MDVPNPSGGADGPDRDRESSEACPDALPEVRAIEEALANAIDALHLAWDALQHALARQLEGREVGHPGLTTLQEQLAYDEAHAHDVVALAVKFHALTSDHERQA